MDQMGSWPEMDLPGFRFHPTEEELLDFYLKGAVHGRKLQPEIIRTINLYRYAPWELPGMARVGEREWYFFVPRDRRNNNGGRPNRTTDGGFWKATGSDRSIRSVSDPKRKIGLKKTLVFYEGRAPRGTRTDWVMNEYRLPEDDDRSSSSAAPKEDIVLCKIYRKATSMKELEQRAAIDKDARSAQYCGAATADNSSSSFSSSSSDHMETSLPKPRPTVPLQVVVTDAGMKEMKVEVEIETEKEAEVTSVAVGPESPGRRRVRPELDVLQLPAGLGFDWAAHDPFLTPLRSPWLDLSPYYANVLNF